MTVKLDTSLEQYEQDGGDKQFIKDITKSIGVDPSQMRITKKREGSVILTFIVNTDQPNATEQLKRKIKNALLNDIPYPVLNIEDKMKSPGANRK